MRAPVLALVAALAGCTCDAPSKPAAGSGSSRAAAGSDRLAGAAGSDAPAAAGAGSPGAAAGSPCTAETAIRVSRVLTDPAHPCRAWILAAYGRLVRIGGSEGGAGGTGGSATIVSTAAARGAGLLVTCRACAGIAAEVAGAVKLPAGCWMIDPEREPPLAFRIGAPARLAAGVVQAGLPRFAAHALFGASDIALAAVSGDPIDPGAAPPAAVSDRALPVEDPRRLAASKAPFLDVRPGAAALVLGFADAEGGELVASVGPVLADEDARRLIARAGAEARRGYDPQAELAIAARALPGMVGGGVFDEGGRFIGVVARALAEPTDGVDLVRAARATAIAARLSAALRAAPVAARGRVLPFLP